MHCAMRDKVLCKFFSPVMCCIYLARIAARNAGYCYKRRDVAWPVSALTL